MNSLNIKNINYSLKRAIEFHGHLGPFLVLGVKMGLLGRNIFGERCSVEVQTMRKPPLSCIIDGVQISSGSTVGNGGLVIKGSEEVSSFFKSNGSTLKILLKKEIQTDLLKVCKGATKKKLEIVAHQMVKISMEKIFMFEENYVDTKKHQDL